MLTQNLISGLNEFITSPHTGISYALVMENEGAASIVKRTDQPCYGEMRVYSKGEHKPGDLHHPFPAGTPIAVGLKFSNIVHPDNNQIVEYLFGPDSPYSEVTKDSEIIKDKSGLRGVIFTNTKVDSDVLVHLFIISRGFAFSGPVYKQWQTFVDAGIGKELSLLYTFQTQLNTKKDFIIRPPFASYTFPSFMDFKAFITHKPNHLEKDWLFYDRKPYHRNQAGNLNDIWKGKQHLSKLTKSPKTTTLQELIDISNTM